MEMVRYMKRIGIIFAMKEELDAFLPKVEKYRKKKIFDLTFYQCNYLNKELVFVGSGVGKVNAARCTQMLIDHMKVDFIFNIGVAGSVDKKVSVLDIVIGEKLVQHDFDITAFEHEKGFIPNVGGIYIPADKELVQLAQTIETESTVHTGVIASGDIFCSDKAMGEKICRKFNTLCVEMEGASIAQVCFLCKVPFLVIRSISDSLAIENNKITYEEFLEISSKRVANFLEKLIQRM
jgi:adenosylhomocysteine nucleosidase